MSAMGSLSCVAVLSWVGCCWEGEQVVCDVLGLLVTDSECQTWQKSFLYFDFNPVRHRDANNEGPNALVAYGRFGRSRLRYWPRDASKVAAKHLGSSGRSADVWRCGVTCGERQGGVCLVIVLSSYVTYSVIDSPVHKLSDQVMVHSSADGPAASSLNSSR